MPNPASQQTTLSKTSSPYIRYVQKRPLIKHLRPKRTLQQISSPKTLSQETSPPKTFSNETSPPKTSSHNTIPKTNGFRYKTSSSKIQTLLFFSPFFFQFFVQVLFCSGHFQVSSFPPPLFASYLFSQNPIFLCYLLTPSIKYSINILYISKYTVPIDK